MRTEKGRERERPPRGVMGCLAGGFEMVGQNPSLAVLPVVLDLLLWLGPRISVGPLIDSFASVLSAQMPKDPETVTRVAEATELLKEFGAQFNLVSVVGGIPLLQAPSLLVRRLSGGGSPLGAPRVVALSSPLLAVPWWAVLVTAGLVIGFLYLNEIAHQMPWPGALPSTDQRDGVEEGDVFENHKARAGAWKLLRFGLFAAGLFVIGSTLVPLWLLMVAIGAVVAQPVGILIWIAGAGFFGYAALHLMFVVPSLLVGERPLRRAIGESVLLSHLNLMSLLGFVVLALVIYEGLGFAWSLPSRESWALLVGILGNSFVATGLTGAAFVFYHDRMRAARKLAVLSS